MIRKNTVLVLGAGASCPYGFPTGTQLRDAIRNLHNITKLDPRLALYDECGVSLPEIRGLGIEFRYSGVKSIDAFLERHPHLVDRNCVRFLTFNYDRSLEFFLYNAIKHTFHVDDNTALDASQHVQSRHIYGAVGEFDHTKSPTARTYSPDLTAARLRLAADGIKIIPNTRKDDAVFQEARAWFEWAEDICFLGFGFDETNCERLGLEDAIRTRQRDGRSTPRVLASVLGLTQEDINAAIVATCRTTGFVPLNHSNLMALRSTNLFRE